mmetsp:Transcript_111252/g.196978  ORF Transcript_111252/g.196978 Transcript_111252/m.196978 type:complete len:533 (-) Transcript_111252:50-1648(-)
MAPLAKLEIEDGCPARSMSFSEVESRRKRCMKCSAVAWTIALFVILGFGFGRARTASFPIDEPLMHAWTALDLEPFDLVVDVKNKREVINQHAGLFGGLVDKFMSDDAFMSRVVSKIVEEVPGQLDARGLQAEVKSSRVQGLRAAITLRITGYDANYLCTQTWHHKCGELFERLTHIPGKLGTLMNDTSYVSVFARHVEENMREGLLERLPKRAMTQLQAEGLDAFVTTDPVAMEWVEPELQTQKEVVLHAEIRSRHKVVEAAKEYAGSWLGLTEAAVNSLAQVNLMAKVRTAVEQEVSTRLERELAGTMGFAVKMLDEADAGSADEKRTFWVHIEVTPQDLVGTFQRQMPPGFAENVSLMLETMEQLAELGLTEMKSSRTTFYNRLLDGFASVLQGKLEEALRVQIGAEVWNVTKAAFDNYQAYAASGRCCAASQDGQQTFWVSKDVLHQQAVADASVSCPLLGCSEALRCPPVVAAPAEAACAHPGSEAVVAPAVETAYQPPEECLELQGEKVTRRARVDAVTTACKRSA